MFLQKPLTDYQQLNQKLKMLLKNRKVKANELISEAEQLDAQKVKNEKFIEKINSFLND